MSRGRRRWLRTSAWLLAGIAVCTQAPAADPALKAGVFDPPREAPDFRLPGTTGKEISVRDWRGKIVVLGFGFTHCPEVCPVTLTTLAAARRQLGAQAAEVQVLWITVDPERDDAARLGAYVTAFDPDFVGATGSEEQLAAVRRDYGIAAARVKRDGLPDSYSHSAFTYLIDREGRLRALMPYGHPAEDFVHDLRLLLGAP
jgi:protein SCO1/2